MREPTILVVEDNPTTRRLVRVTLAKAGYRVIEAESGRVALMAMEREGPDLVIQDLGLADMDGFALRRDLMALGSRDLPIVAFTGLDDEHRILSAGFVDFLLKPASPAQIVDAVERNLGGREAHPTDVIRHILVVGEDSAVLLRHESSLHRHGFDVSTARTGAEALEKLARKLPDLIAIDILTADGNEICSKLRADRVWAKIPVILMGMYDPSDAERSWAARLGAHALATRSADLRPVIETVLRRTLEPSRSTLTRMPSRQHHAVVNQLKTESRLRTELARRTQIWNAVSSMLADLAHLTEGSKPGDAVAVELLASLLHASGFTIGAAYLASQSGELVLRAHLGWRDAAQACLPDFWGHSDRLAATLESAASASLSRAAANIAERELLDEAEVGSLLIVPLVARGERIGVLVLASPNPELPDGWLEMAGAVAGPIAQALALSAVVARLSASASRFQGLAEATADGIIVTNGEGVITYVNPAAEQIFVRPAVDLVHCPAELIMPFLRSGESQGNVTRGDGRLVPIELSEQMFEDPPGHANHVYVIRDLSQRLQLEQFMHLANHDALTGLYNRRRFEEELGSRLAESRRHGTVGALLIIDIDHFKSINDSLGHPAGDEVLAAVGRVLMGTTRASDTAARYGGDEFALLLNHATRAGAEIHAAGLVARLAALDVGGDHRKVAVGVSIGIALYPEHGATRSALFASADRALYRAKESGRGQAVVGALDGAASVPS